MDLIVVSLALYGIATGSTAGWLATAVRTGKSFLARAGVNTTVTAPHINPGWISGGPIELEEDRTPAPKLSNRLLAIGIGNLVLLLLITGAILAAAILFVVGAFTAGSALSVFLSSFFVLALTVGALVFGARKARQAYRVIMGKQSSNSHAPKLVAEGAVWLFAINGLGYAAIFLFVAGIIRFFV